MDDLAGAERSAPFLSPYVDSADEACKDRLSTRVLDRQKNSSGVLAPTPGFRSSLITLLEDVLLEPPPRSKSITYL